MAWVFLVVAILTEVTATLALQAAVTGSRCWYALVAAGHLVDLRHTFASLMLAAGFKTYEVSRWMGHASVATTDGIYAHLYPNDYDSHITRFEAYVAAASRFARQSRRGGRLLRREDLRGRIRR